MKLLYNPVCKNWLQVKTYTIEGSEFLTPLIQHSVQKLAKIANLQYREFQFSDTLIEVGWEKLAKIADF